MKKETKVMILKEHNVSECIECSELFHTTILLVIAMVIVAIGATIAGKLFNKMCGDD